MMISVSWLGRRAVFGFGNDETLRRELGTHTEEEPDIRVRSATIPFGYQAEVPDEVYPEGGAP